MAQVLGSFSVIVNPGSVPLTMTPQGGNLPDETQGTADAGDLVCVVSGGQLPYTFAVTQGSLPPGMQLVGSTNPDGSETVSISGTPTQSGAFSFELTVTDAAGAQASTTRVIG